MIRPTLIDLNLNVKEFDMITGITEIKIYLM